MPGFALLIGASVASLNLCADEYLLLLGRREEIAGVSYLSHDPRESPLWRKARAFPANRGRMEDVLRDRPDVILTMGGGGRHSAALARRSGLRAIDLPMPQSLETVADNLRTVARALGDPARARPWLSRLKRLRATRPGRLRDAIWLGGGGASIAAPSLGAQWMALAGLAQRPLPGNRASLETILTDPPAVILQSDYRRAQASAGTRWLDHPIVRNARSERRTTDGRPWTCMGPTLIDEVERLRGRR